MKKRVIKKIANAYMKGRWWAGVKDPYFWPQTSDGTGVWVTEAILPPAVREYLIRKTMARGHCVMGPCQVQTLSNADRIRAMSDDDMADTMCRNPIFTVCDAVCKGDCKAVDTLNDTKEAVCKRTILDWLHQPAEED